MNGSAPLPPTPTDGAGPDAQGGRHDTSAAGAAKPMTAQALKVVAVMEALKGVLVFAAGFGFLTLLHRDVRQLAVAFVTRLHLDPEHRYVGVFLEAASHVTDANLWGAAALAAAYTLLRWVEAYGLWKGRRWAAWLGAASGAIYIPIEVHELWHRPTAMKVGALIFNVAVVAYLLWSLRRQPARAAPGRGLTSSSAASAGAP